MEKELTRNEFRNAVLQRDGYKCVICGKSAQFDDTRDVMNLDAHHILERRLWGKSQGYFINNGASLCETHHLQAEMTTLSCEEIRKAAGITDIILPEHLYQDVEYDKWGNEILKNGTRIKGELFDDESVQKILKAGNVLSLFTNRVKYSRTFHLPWSPGMNRDDRMMTDTNIFNGQRVMIMEKMDGENCLDENTMITTEDGYKTIKWICETRYRGKILCYDTDSGMVEYQPIINWQILEDNNDWYEIVLDNEIKIILTGNHYVWLPELLCYRMVKDLKIGDNFLINEKN